MRKLIACIALFGCASQGVPPGGPPDTQAPIIIAITPDSGATAIKRKLAVFRFDEVVSEKPAGATTLGDLVVVSPRQGAPDVSWHRDEIHVKPRGGWLPNTTYTVTMLPGIADLRGNVKNTGSSTYFSTGSTIDKGTIGGTVYDLLSGSASPKALVQAHTGADTTVSWITFADSAGHFRLAHLPMKTFSVRAYVDKNRNFGSDPGEPYDTMTIAVADSAVSDFFVVVHDSIAPRLATALATDSVTLAVSFDEPSDSASAFNVASYTVIGADSATIRILAVKPPQRDTAHRRPVVTRSLPVVSVTLTLAAPLDAKKQYHLRAVGIRGLLGQSLPTETQVRFNAPPATPVRPPPPPNLPGGAVPIPIKRD